MSARKRLLLISSVSTGGKNFFARLVGEIVTVSEENDFDVLIKMVKTEEDYRIEPQLNLLHKLLREECDFDVMCIIPTSPEFTTNMVIELIEERNVLIAIDVRYEDISPFERKKIKPPPIVQVDNISGGRLASETLSKFFLKNRIENPTVLTISGPVGLMHARDREKGFLDEFRKIFPESKIIKLEPGDWFREKAEKNFNNFLKLNKNKEINGIFAGNDEMALGIRKAIIKAKKRGDIEISQDVKIMGFDNITEMQELIETEDEYILGTIDQNLNLMAKELIKLARNMMNDISYQEEILISPFVNINEKFIIKDGIEHKNNAVLLKRISGIFENFNNYVRHLSHRKHDRPNFNVVNEYDVQDLLYLLLDSALPGIEFGFQDEEWTPKNLDQSKRADFVIRKNRLIIETKYIRDEAHAKSVFHDMNEKINYYYLYPELSDIVFFIYDPDAFIENPIKKVKEFSGRREIKDKKFNVHLFIRPI